ncbi:hypothetical protein KP509_31G026900 [Ceratopteris richardii]|uniref:Uncharacterized protein n=1 Tax=Ceratopteris richardii TaxID=49495 RepID=A0A8T2QYP8_CERRI|nr:hypothetical protein KP509_31G026900 [Ceratopteris richardii]
MCVKWFLVYSIFGIRVAVFVYPSIFYVYQIFSWMTLILLLYEVVLYGVSVVMINPWHQNAMDTTGSKTSIVLCKNVILCVEVLWTLNMNSSTKKSNDVACASSSTVQTSSRTDKLLLISCNSV